MGDPSNDAFMRNQSGGVEARPKVPARVNVLQLKLIGQSHPTGLTPNLLKLFEARPPLEYKPPPEKRQCPPYHGIAHFVTHFAQPSDPEYSPPVKEVETPAQKKARIHQLRLQKGAAKAAEELEKYDPTNDLNVNGDPYKTLFVARLSYETTESRLKREFETYGPIKRVKMIFDQKSNKPRGYAFVEFAHTRDMKAAYKQADGRKIDGRRVLVDVERGRTVPSWRPRRLGGGLGSTRAGGEDTTRVGGEDATRAGGEDATRVGGEEANPRHSSREIQSGGPSRSQEPRLRGDREREKSRERGRDKEREREKSRERSNDRPRDREHREDRNHRDRDRARDKDRERDHSGREHRERDRTRDRERGRDRGRDNERERDRDHHPREREREYEVVDGDSSYRGRSHDREYDYDRLKSKNDMDRRTERPRGYDHGEDDQGWYDQSDHGHRHREAEPEGKQYEHYQSRREYDERSEEGEGAGEDNYNHEGAN